MFHSQQGSTHQNGDHFVGRPPRPVRDLWLEGTPPVSILFRKSVTPLIERVKVGSGLNVEFDGQYWWASSKAGIVGRLTWSRAEEERVTWFDYEIRYPNAGVLHVERMLVNADGAKVNCNGFVVPA